MSIDAAFSAGDAIKFPEVGAATTFTVTDVAEEERTDYDGNPETVVVVHGTDDDGDDVRLFCQKGQLRFAIGAAVKEATGKAGSPQPGGKLHVKRGPDGTASKAGFSPPHSYTAKYQPPAPGAKVADSAFGGGDAAGDSDPY